MGQVARQPPIRVIRFHEHGVVAPYPLRAILLWVGVPLSFSLAGPFLVLPFAVSDIALKI